MRKIMYIWICVLLVFLPVHVSASFVVEEEVEVSSGDINGNQQPQSAPEEPAQQQPQIQTEPSPSTYTSGNRPNSTVSPKKPEVTEQKKEQESTENTETENISIEETETVVPETENVEQPVTEAIETETAVPETAEPETETHELLETEMAAIEENVSDTETDKERSNDNNENIAKADLQRAVGMLCILIAVAGGIYLFYGQVKLYNLSSDHKYSYIGMCRISVKRDCVQIHMSKFLMNRGRSGEYKIVVSNRILKRRSGKMCVLLLPEHERIEAGVLRKEILFQYE